MFSGYWKFIAKLVASITLLGVLFIFVDWREGLSLLLEVDLKPLVLVFALYAIGLWLCSVKWRMLLNVHEVSVPVAKLFRFYWIGAFISNFLPSTVGGDFSRLTFLRSTNRLAEVAASIVLERMTGMFMLIVFSGFSLSLRAHYFGDSFLLLVLWLIFGLSLGALLVSFIYNRNIVVWLGQLSLDENGFTCKFLVKAKKVLVALLFCQEQKLVLFNCLALSFVFYCLSFLGQQLIFFSLGLSVPFTEIMFILPLVSLISFVPISLNSIGLTESAFVFFFVQAGMQPSEALAAALLGRILTVLFSSFGGILLLIENNTIAKTPAN